MAFNALEAQLAATVKALPQTLTPSTTASRKPLEKLVKVWAAQGGLIVAQCWTMLNAAFNLQSITELPEEWIPDAIAWVQGKIDALPATLPPAALQAQALPLYREGLFYPPRNAAKHLSGPSETALTDLWNDFSRRTGGIEREFMTIMRDIDRYNADAFAHAVSDMGRNADTFFSVDCLTQGLYCAQTTAISSFKSAMEGMRLHLRMARSLAVAQGR